VGLWSRRCSDGKLCLCWQIYYCVIDFIRPSTLSHLIVSALRQKVSISTFAQIVK
jgi:hypothetical protein